MTIARYYLQRLPFVVPPAEDTLTIRAPNPWTWARIRGADASHNRLSPIRFSGGIDRVSLVVSVSAADRHLENSRYEIVLGDSHSSPTDPALTAPAQHIIVGTGITFNNPQGFTKMDRDPPPPPGGDWTFNWSFEPAINIT